MKRREFMAKTSSAVLGAGLLPNVLLRGEQAPGKTSRVIEVFHEGSVREGRRVDPAAVRRMLRSGLQALTGTEQP